MIRETYTHTHAHIKGEEEVEQEKVEEIQDVRLQRAGLKSLSKSDLSDRTCGNWSLVVTRGTLTRGGTRRCSIRTFLTQTVICNKGDALETKDGTHETQDISSKLKSLTPVDASTTTTWR